AHPGALSEDFMTALNKSNQDLAAVLAGKKPIAEMSGDILPLQRSAYIILGGSHKGEEFTGWGDGVGASVHSQFWGAINSVAVPKIQSMMTMPRDRFIVPL
ncbi:MAG TPA: hypothetical protein PKW15_06915, partial [Alphaproteobacteria bacterium]|nr:hypothetical protein [Alphaproteobacteria bacterium]